MKKKAGACGAFRFTGVGVAMDPSWAALGLSGTRVGRSEGGGGALRLSWAVLRYIGLYSGIVGPSWCPLGCVG